MNKKRPVNLDLTKFHFPVMAIMSVCHRISGVLLFLFLPLFIYLLHGSLVSAEGFRHIQELMMNSFMKFVIWVAVCVTLFHLVAGIRHLIMDLGFGESVRAGRASSYVVFSVAIVLFILAGVWLW